MKNTFLVSVLATRRLDQTRASRGHTTGGRYRPLDYYYHSFCGCIWFNSFGGCIWFIMKSEEKSHLSPPFERHFSSTIFVMKSMSPYNLNSSSLPIQFSVEFTFFVQGEASFPSRNIKKRSASPPCNSHQGGFAPWTPTKGLCPLDPHL
ncbi:hypothetical protein V1264_001211 [Littorina saxatilis]|uniref:Uncharacterized protein n=1 Tax=Littorina saxatilis TaxID=31220 RepID=A0AAN9GPF7_9CAEN